MKHTLQILLLTFSLLPFAEIKGKEHKSFQSEKFFPRVEQRSVLIGQISNINDFTDAPRKITLAVDDISVDYQHSFETEIDKEGNFIFDIPLFHSINTWLTYGDGRITPYLFPNDTLYIKCQIDTIGSLIGIVSCMFKIEDEKFQNDFFQAQHWIHRGMLNPFRDNLSNELSPQELKKQYLDFEKELLEQIENIVVNYSLDDLIADYMRYSASYSIYTDIIMLSDKIENQQERQEFFSFITDSIAFNKDALITSDYMRFLNWFRFNVESHPRVYLEPKERTTEQFRLDITTKNLEANLKRRHGIWSEFLAASDMFRTAFLEEEIDHAVLTTYSELIKENFNDPYIRQLLLSKVDKTREKVEIIKSQKIPEKAILNHYASKSGEDLLNKILTDNKGSDIYIKVWATWCSPCKRQIPHSLKMQERFSEVVFVYLCSQSIEDVWKNVIRQYQINGTHILLTDEQFGYLREKFSISGVPHYILIDNNGLVYFNTSPGCEPEQVLEEKLKSLTVSR